ncbi:hypothetical protein REPUB_Repub10bG0066700 [Reevesia pubescens]
MKIISWNVHGLERKEKRRAVRRLVLFNKPDLLLLQESNTESDDDWFVRSLWGRDPAQVAVSGFLRSSGGRRKGGPWILYLQKLGLELKCSICLNLFKQPLLFPCDHLFCEGTKLSSFLEDGVDKSDKFDKCSMLRHVIDKGYKTLNKREVQYNSAGKVDLLCPLSQKQVGASQESGNRQMSMNQVDQTPSSPLSYGDTKCSDNDSSDHMAKELDAIVDHGQANPATSYILRVCDAYMLIWL